MQGGTCAGEKRKFHQSHEEPLYTLSRSSCSEQPEKPPHLSERTRCYTFPLDTAYRALPHSSPVMIEKGPTVLLCYLHQISALLGDPLGVRELKRGVSCQGSKGCLVFGLVGYMG